jgi:hypothetical protein
MPPRMGFFHKNSPAGQVPGSATLPRRGTAVYSCAWAGRYRGRPVQRIRSVFLVCRQIAPADGCGRSQHPISCYRNTAAHCELPWLIFYFMNCKGISGFADAKSFPGIYSLRSVIPVSFWLSATPSSCFLHIKNKKVNSHDTFT